MASLADVKASEAAYSVDQAAAWLRRIALPSAFERYVNDPTTFPKTADSLRVLFQCQITTFPYENLSVHYSGTHQVNIKPHVLYTKMMGPDSNGRGGYCMELSIFFHHMLRAVGFCVYMTGVRNRTRLNGVPQGEYQGWTHINNIVSLPSGDMFSADVAFGGDGPTSPLQMIKDESPTVKNLGPQEVRLIHQFIPKQRLRETKLWIYQYRNSAEDEWNPFYSFSEVEFFQEDFEVQNWWTSAKTLHRWTVLVVRFLRQGEPVMFPHDSSSFINSHTQMAVTGKIMLINDTIKVNMGGKTQVLHRVQSEQERVQALWDYFGIRLTECEAQSIAGWDMALP